ncbi:MAG: hypothetical protein NTX76_03390 [Alphaproteobacteria bacterium]|nr:hypothetical protein [Alphaproteobacteria bacterium]
MKKTAPVVRALLPAFISVKLQNTYRYVSVSMQKEFYRPKTINDLSPNEQKLYLMLAAKSQQKNRNI